MLLILLVVCTACDCDLGSCDCSRCNTHGLAKSGVNASGALAILNLYSCDTGVQRITRHHKASASVLHYDATWQGLCDDYRGGDGRYYLEGKLELLDGPEEWLLDQDTHQIMVAVPPKPRAAVRARVSDHALVVQNSSWMRFANLSFFATTLSATGDVHNMSFSSLVFNYSAVSRRALGETTPPVGLTVWRAAVPLATWRPPSNTTCETAEEKCCPGLGGHGPRMSDPCYKCVVQHSSYFEKAGCWSGARHTFIQKFCTAPTLAAGTANFIFEDLTVRYSDGPALMVSGSNTQLSDSLFEWNDYTAVGGSWPLGVPPHGKAHRATTVWINGGPDDAATATALYTLRRLSFRNNGAAQCITAGGAHNLPVQVELNFFEKQLAMQDDGSFVEGGGTPSTNYQFNWATNSGKAGLRWDGYYPGTLGGYMRQNVAWNCSQMVVKGDRHNVTRNTVFDASDTTASHAKHDRPRYQDHTSALNNLSTCVACASVGVGTGTK